MDLKPNVPSNQKDYTGPLCGHPKAEAWRGNCSRPAGYGTAHFGQGYCMSHGGNDVSESVRGTVPYLTDVTQKLTVADLEQLVDAGTAALVIARARLLERLLQPGLTTKEVSDLTSSVQRLDVVLSKRELPELSAMKGGGGDPFDDELKRLLDIEGQG